RGRDHPGRHDRAGAARQAGDRLPAGSEDRFGDLPRAKLGQEGLMHLIAQTVTDGLVLGGIYALSAVGFSLIFGVLHVINLSHGILVLLGAYLALIFSQALRIDPLLCIPPVMVV